MRWILNLFLLGLYIFIFMLIGSQCFQNWSGALESGFPLYGLNTWYVASFIYIILIIIFVINWTLDLAGNITSRRRARKERKWRREEFKYKKFEYNKELERINSYKK